jgi:hypothetical protein
MNSAADAGWQAIANQLPIVVVITREMNARGLEISCSNTIE